MKPAVIVIGGPTASGKSALALELAEDLARRGQAAEILCADSITVYRGFEIGAAKPSVQERARIPHHLLDLAGPEENFTAGDFLAAASPLVERLLAEGIFPLVAGGSGFYLRALLRGMASGEEDAERAAELKARLEERAEKEGWDSLFEELRRKDPGSLSVVHPNDHYRIIRALQAMELSGKPWSERNKEARATPPRFPYLYFRLKTEREELKKRIEQRTALMLEQGLLKEVEALLARGIRPGCKPMQSVGYRECVDVLQGNLPRESLQAAIVQSTSRLAKQQSTWFKGEELAEWLEPPHLEGLMARIRETAASS